MLARRFRCLSPADSLIMRILRLDTLSDLPAAEWNALVPDRNPFLSHEFLSALERHQCVGQHTGWLPWHVICRDEPGRLLVPALDKP